MFTETQYVMDSAHECLSPRLALYRLSALFLLFCFLITVFFLVLSRLFITSSSSSCLALIIILSSLFVSAFTVNSFSSFYFAFLIADFGPLPDSVCI